MLIPKSDSNESMFHRSPEEIEHRKQCIELAREYYNSIDLAYKQLQDCEKTSKTPEQLQAQQHTIYQDLLRLTERCLKSANWEISLFFKGIGMRIQELHDSLESELNKENTITQQDAQTHQTNLENTQIIFVSLYQADGNNLRKWAHVLNNLLRLSVGRPIYKNEQDIYNVIRAKAEQRNDAYVSVRINNEDIIPPLGGITPRDRMNNDLLTVREGAIKPENIVEFIHLTGRYRFSGGLLVKIEP